jgi:VanZ family protein
MELIIARSKPLALAWIIIMSVLFFLPGSALPSESWMDRIYMDKWVHCGLFAVLIFLSSLALELDTSKKVWLLISLSIVYGVLVEIIQGNWVANRSSDSYDVAADTAGCIVGWFVWLRVYKKINPCRNRGRNQN